MSGLASDRRDARRNIAMFLGFAVLFSGFAFTLMLVTGSMGSAGGIVSYMLMAMWGPGLAALAVCQLRGIRWSSLGWSLGPARYAWLAYVLPITYAVPVYLIAWLTGLAGFHDVEKVAKWADEFGWQALSPGAVILAATLLLASFGMLKSIGMALGEEIGWRGFMVPQLAKLNGFTGIAIWSGVFWSLFHYPALIFGSYGKGVPLWWSLPCFTVMVFGQCFVYTWLRLRSSSLWPAVLLHASHHLWIQAILDPLTLRTQASPFVTGEFGIGLALTSAFAGWWFWRRRNELTMPEH